MTNNATNTITATPADANADVVITVNGEPHENGTAFTWEADENEVVITVTNGDETLTYTVGVTAS